MPLQSTTPAENLIYLSTDSFGIKPLYYALTDQSFVFASEPFAILASGFVSKNLSLDSIYNYFSYRSVQSEQTLLLSEVKRVPPATTLIFSVSTRQLNSLHFTTILPNFMHSFYWVL